MYQTLPAGAYPSTAAVAPHLYGSLEEQFAHGLDRLLDDLGITRDRPGASTAPGRRPATVRDARRCRSQPEPDGHALVPA